MERRSGRVTFHLRHVAVNSQKDALRVDHRTLELPLVALLQALYLKDHRVGGAVRQRDVAVLHAAQKHGVAEIIVAGADDVEAGGGRAGWWYEAELKVLGGVWVGEAAHVASDGEPGALDAVQGPRLRLGDHLGPS